VLNVASQGLVRLGGAFLFLHGTSCFLHSLVVRCAGHNRANGAADLCAYGALRGLRRFFLTTKARRWREVSSRWVGTPKRRLHEREWCAGSPRSRRLFCTSEMIIASCAPRCYFFRLRRRRMPSPIATTATPIMMTSQGTPSDQPGAACFTGC